MFNLWLNRTLKLIRDLAERLDENWPLTAVEMREHAQEDGLDRSNQSKYNILLYITNVNITAPFLNSKKS